MLLSLYLMLVMHSPSANVEPFRLLAVEWSIDQSLPTANMVEGFEWQKKGPREKLFPAEGKGLIFDLSDLKLKAQDAWVLRLNHARLGFRLRGLNKKTGMWEAIESRAELPLGVVLTEDQLAPFAYLFVQNTGTSIGLLNLHRMSQFDVIRTVKDQGVLQLIVFGVFAFLVVSSILLRVFFRRWVYGWYTLYLFGAWLVVWVAAPGNSTIPSWYEDWFPAHALGVSSSALGFVGILRSAFLEQVKPSLKRWTERSMIGLIVALLPGLFWVPSLLELFSGLMLQGASLFLVPYLFFRVKPRRSWSSLWLFGAFVSNLFGLTVGLLELSGDGLSVFGATFGLCGIVFSHIGLLALFVVDDFGSQRAQLMSLKRAMDEDVHLLDELHKATESAFSELERERATQRRLVAERQEANIRLSTVNENLKLSFERMIETKRYATLGGFWPQFSRALMGGMERLMLLRQSLDPALRRTDHPDLIARMDTALDSCWGMAEAVEGALEFEPDTTTELPRVISMAVTLLGWGTDDPSLQLRTESTLKVRGAHAEWLQLMMNLLANSRQALEASRVELKDRGRVALTGRKVDGGVEIVVEDSGRGWTPELLQMNLTDILDETHRRSGLGLAICATICKRYSASMSLRRSSLGGAAVVIEIPDFRPAEEL